MNRLTILGIGNYLLGDDGIGNYILEELIHQNPIRNAHLVIGETDIDYCLDQISLSDYLIVIDCVIAGKEPGTVSIYPINENISVKEWRLSLHNQHLFNELCRRSINGYIVGVEPFDTDYKFGLSPTLKRAFPSIMNKVKNFLHAIINKE
jgi:hydrogenase maturation protease